MIKIIVPFVFSLFIFACDPVAEIKHFMPNVIPQATFQAKPTGEEIQISEKPGKAASSSARAKENSELLSEMMKVVFDEPEIEDKSAFGMLVSTLNQGASLEGIYQGIVMGSRYRALESKSQAASPEQLKVFAVMMTDLQMSMKNPSVFIPEEAKHAPSIDYPDGTPGIPSTISTQVVERKKDKQSFREELVATFIGASGFTLKRTLGQEALKKLDEMKSDTGDLGQWYAQFVLKMCDTKIDFGLELRNKPDFDFHFAFAQRLALDRVKWEVLNRYHRYLNSLSK